MGWTENAETGSLRLTGLKLARATAAIISMALLGLIFLLLVATSAIAARALVGLVMSESNGVRTTGFFVEVRFSVLPRSSSGTMADF